MKSYKLKLGDLLYSVYTPKHLNPYGLVVDKDDQQYYILWLWANKIGARYHKDMEKDLKIGNYYKI